MEKSALIVGAGAGLSSSLAFQCKNSGMHVALAARDIGKLKSISEKTGASLHKCDASKIEDVNLLFEELDAKSGTPDLVCLLYTSPSPRDATLSRMPSSA